MPHLQQDQPEGVPPLELTGERTLPDVPEENYWYRRHLAVYEWIAGAVGGLSVADLACGEGYGSDVLAARRRRGGRRRRQPRGPRARAAALPAPEPALRARPGRELRRPLRRDRLPADDRAHRTIRARCCGGFAAAAPVAYVSTPNRLTLAPPGAEKSDNPWHLREYTLAEYRELLEPCFARVEILGLFHARKLRAHELALRAGWDRVHKALRITKPFYDRFTPAIAASDFTPSERPTRRDLDGALDFVAVCRA